MSNTAGALSRTLGKFLRRSVGIVLSILAGVFVGSLIMIWYKQNPVEIYGQLLKGAYGSQRSLFIGLQRATPLIFTALASTLAFRTGVFNVGVEGQFFIGAIAGTYVGYAFQMPAIIHLPLTLLTGFVAGAAWAFVPTLMRQKLGVSEIVTTIMTNYIATFLISYLTNYPMRADPTTPDTPPIMPTARLPQFIEMTRESANPLGKGTQAHLGILVAVAVVAVMYFIFKRTKIGFEWRMVGISFPFSEFAGMNLDRTFISGMLVSGGLAGLGGSVEIMGVWREYKNLFATGFGFKGNLAALLGGQSILGSTVAALFYGSMEAGALGLEWSAGIPRQLIDIVVGLIIFFMAAEGMWDFVKRIKWARAPEEERRTTQELEA
ncbi:MAG TPA: ABC transporter permease [Anaerolineae bacterium]|nr:ABC transporter permease [Anaerolineae bacterium]